MKKCKLGAVRYPAIHKMVTETFARIEPEGYAEMLQALSADWKPTGADMQIVELMADIACRMRGCNYLEAEILNRQMAACAIPEDQPGDALGRAYLRDMQGPHLLDKLSLYYSHISKDFTRCLRLLERRSGGRDTQQMSTAKLAGLKTCTPVVQ